MSVELRKEHTSCEGCAIEFKSGYDSVCLKCTDDYLNWCHYAPRKDPPKLVLVVEEAPQKISFLQSIINWVSGNKIREEPKRTELGQLSCSQIAEEANKINDRMAPLASEYKYTPETDIERQNRLSHKAMMDKINKMEWLKD